MKYSEKWSHYAKQWDNMIIKSERVKEFERVAKYAISHKKTYLTIAARTSDMLWAHIALLHWRESSGNFKTYLGNGQSLSKRTTIVPKGRGPFTGDMAFIDGALDALHIDGLDKIQDWRLEKILYFCEVFNGGGYNRKGLPSPYIWGGTNVQVAGKYVKDGAFRKYVWDTQPGCAPILWMIQKMDPTVEFLRES